MPTISVFYGIVVTMNYREHEPPHFHVRYGEHRALIGIDPVKVLRGRLPARARAMVIEWAALHQRELIENWGRARAEQPLARVDPLD